MVLMADKPQRRRELLGMQLELLEVNKTNIYLSREIKLIGYLVHYRGSQYFEKEKLDEYLSMKDVDDKVLLIKSFQLKKHQMFYAFS